ncbi:M56 family metallopeptidase [Arenimonas sp. MALMAid1274]|uniref:M56 family metallopeptidase n=1 Tax=Arenimonas sp. MALMAid1274 TaxID=3411630 RepID=UPI003BA3B2B3
MSALDLATSFLLTLAVHATVLLGAAWLAERAGGLRHTGWAELAWRVALFGALASASFAVLVPAWRETARPVVASVPDQAGSETSSTRAPADAMSSASQTAAALPQAIAAPASSRDAVPMPALAPSPRENLRPAPIALPGVIASGLLALWMLVIVLGALRLAMQGLALHRLGRATAHHGETADEALKQHARQLAAELGIAAPSLRISRAVASPMVLPGARVLLPAWTLTLDETQQRALLAHELSHLQRRDPAWRVAQRLALLPLAFHPLARHACRRLEALAEDACDARAMQLMGSGLPLAECLATCLTHAGAHAGQPALAVAMAGESGPVLRRVQNLLEESPMSIRPLSPALRRTAIALAVVALVALPGLAVTTLASELAEGGYSRHMFSDDDSISISHSENGYKLRLKMTGKVVFNADSTDIAHLGPGATFRVSETRDGVEREVRYFGKDGVIQREYRRAGKEVPLDADGRAWLAKTLPDVMRESGINAEQRGQALLAKGGVPALLDEIALIESDHSAARYLAVLFKHARPDAAQMTRALALAKDISSDFELRQALQAALSSPGMAPAQQVQLLDLAQGIGSDFEQAELLSSLAESGELQGEVLAAWKRAVATIGSDFEQRRVIEAMFERGKASPAAVVVALDLAQGISSDFETREVLTAAAPRLGASAEARAAWFRLAATLGSDFELREALNALMDAGKVDVATADGVLVALTDIGSDFEASEVLKALARVMPADAGLIERYRAAARQLGAFERGEVEQALDRLVSSR